MQFYIAKETDYETLQNIKAVLQDSNSTLVVPDDDSTYGASFDDIGAAGSYLLDVSAGVTSAQFVELGIAYAVKTPILVLSQPGVYVDPEVERLALEIIEFEDYAELPKLLDAYDSSRSFTGNDRVMLYMIVVLFWLGMTWGLAQFYLPLGIIGPLLVWLLARAVSSRIRAYDRATVFLPLATTWILFGTALSPVSSDLAALWLVCYWPLVAFVAKKLKFAI